MEAQAYALFQALGSRATRESLDLVVALLETPASVEELSERTGVASSTASRRLDDLALVGMVSRHRPRDPYTITCPEATRVFLEAASELAMAALGARRTSEEQFRRRVRKSRLKPSEANTERGSSSA